MRVNYYGYYIKNKETGEGSIFNIKNMMRAFCDIDSPSYKNNFFHIDENLYLFKRSNDVFLFVMTRSNEVIKRINRKEIGVEEIYKILQIDESLGFASYIFIDNGYIG
ncbi:hypothetical protein, partial [Methylovulum psychrotolerans]